MFQADTTDEGDVLPWDSARPYTDRSDFYNRGCPVGYFAQFVPPGSVASSPSPSGNPLVAIRCRRIDTTTPETLRDESGISAEEALGVLRDAVSDTGGQVGAAVGDALGAVGSWTPLVLLLAILLVGRNLLGGR